MRGLGESHVESIKKEKILPCWPFSSRQGDRPCTHPAGTQAGTGVHKSLRSVQGWMSFLRAGLSVEAGEEVAATWGLAGWLRGLKGGVAGWSEEFVHT